MSITSLLGVARDALLAQAQGVDVAGQNISNATTPGYVRRSLLLETRSTRGGPQGGVFASGLARSWDAFAHERVVTESGHHGAASARSGALEAAMAVLHPGTGQTVGDRMTAFFGAWSDLANKADDPTARAAVLSKASDLAQSISGAANGLATARADLFTESKGVAGELNARLAKIADLNEQIATAQGLGDGAEDLRDQRGQLVREVGERIDVKAIADASGKLTLLSSGSVLVDGGGASSIGVDMAPGGDLAIELRRPSGTVLDITAAVTSGTLGGLREARDKDIPALANKLDQIAFDLATSVNAVHITGFGLDGQGNRPLFAPPAAVSGAAYSFAIDPSVAGQPQNLAASKTAAGLPGDNSAALSMAQLGLTPLGAFGGSPAEAFAGLLGDVGVKKNAADSELSLRQATMGQASDLLESTTGVSVEEEMVNLTRYQRAFEASMKVLRTADELLSGLIRDL